MRFSCSRHRCCATLCLCQMRRCNYLRGSISAHLPYLLSVNEKQYRNRQECNSQEAKEAGRPWDTQLVIHLYSEEWKASTSGRSEKTVRGDGAVGVHQVDIDDVAQTPCYDGKPMWWRTIYSGTYCKNIIKIPAPIGMPARTWGTHVICGLLVHANQNRPMGNRIAPTIIGTLCDVSAVRIS